MSVSRWKYTEQCDGDYCCGDCDYCNKEPEAYQTYDGKWQVECFVCHARSWWADTKEEAEAKWNKREKSWKDGET